MYEFLVIGKGCFGAAAIRYLSLISDSVGIIGPDEPTDWASHQGVFSSHYDEGRIASYTGPDAVWTQLDQASMNQYHYLEKASGISFYTPSGRMTASRSGSQNVYPYHSEPSEKVHHFTPSTLPSDFPVCFPPDYDIFFEEAPSGYINPRAMIRAQLTLAARQGADIICQRVTAVHNQGSYAEITMENGQSTRARKVVLATGVYTIDQSLLPYQLALRNQSLTLLLAELPQSEARRMAHLPPINYKIESSPLTHIYLLPPLRYPDGRYYLKMGCSTPEDKLLPTLTDLHNWFISNGSKTHLKEMQEILRTILPGLQISGWKTKPCAVSYTPFGKPIIDSLAGCLYVVAGGNGGGAHPSDAIGHLMANFIAYDHWPQTLDQRLFRCQNAANWSEWMNIPLSAWAGENQFDNMRNYE